MLCVLNSLVFREFLRMHYNLKEYKTFIKIKMIVLFLAIITASCLEIIKISNLHVTCFKSTENYNCVQSVNNFFCTKATIWFYNVTILSK